MLETPNFAQTEFSSVPPNFTNFTVPLSFASYIVPPNVAQTSLTSVPPKLTNLTVPLSFLSYTLVNKFYVPFSLLNDMLT